MTELSEDDIALAGEYVLGTLDHIQRLDATRRRTTDRAFAREVEAWETRLDPMLDILVPAPPPVALWKRIDAQLFTPSRPAAPWRWLAAASVFSTAILAAVLWFGHPVSGPPGPLWVSNMVSDSGEVRLTALYDAGRGEMRVSMEGAPPPEGRDFELWLIRDDGDPISLGVMPRDGQAAMPIEEELRDLVVNATLAITAEPLGGARSGVASGPLVAAAPLRRI